MPTAYLIHPKLCAVLQLELNFRSHQPLKQLPG